MQNFKRVFVKTMFWEMVAISQNLFDRSNSACVYIFSSIVITLPELNKKKFFTIFTAFERRKKIAKMDT